MEEEEKEEKEKEEEEEEETVDREGREELKVEEEELTAISRTGTYAPKNCVGFDFGIPLILSVSIVIHSFFPDISIAPLQVHYYSEVLPCRLQHGYGFMPKPQRQLRVKDLPKVSTWRLEQIRTRDLRTKGDESTDEPPPRQMYYLAFITTTDSSGEGAGHPPSNTLLITKRKKEN